MTDQELRDLIASNAESIKETRELVNKNAKSIEALTNDIQIIANLVIQHNARLEALEPNKPSARKTGRSTTSPTVAQAVKPRN